MASPNINRTIRSLEIRIVKRRKERSEAERKSGTLVSTTSSQTKDFEGFEVRGRIFALKGILIYDGRVVFNFNMLLLLW